MALTPDRTLVIGDAHVAPRQPLRRFDWANRLIHDVQPNRIVIIGDFVTMDSLSDWDKDKRKKMEGRRYKADVECGLKALEQLLWQVPLSVEIIFCEGNHENRLDRYLDTHPELDGSVSIKRDLLDYVTMQGYNLTYVPYKEYWTYKGVSFTHVPIQESGRPVGGKTATSRSLSIHQNSVVFGHTHKFDVACEHRHNATHLNQAINVGCFFEHIDEYARGSVTSYWRGLVLLDHYSHNRVDITTFSLGRIKALYS